MERTLYMYTCTVCVYVSAYRALNASSLFLPTHTANQVPPTRLRGERERERERENKREKR